MVKIASCKLPRNESMTRAPTIITTPMTLKFGEVFASAKVKRIRPITKRIAEIYSWMGYFLLKPGINAPITITGSTYTPNHHKSGNELEIELEREFNCMQSWQKRSRRNYFMRFSGTTLLLKQEKSNWTGFISYSLCLLTSWFSFIFYFFRFSYSKQ